MRGLKARGHDVTFLERDTPWYAAHRDLVGPAYGRVELYIDIDNLKDCYLNDIQNADVVMVGSRLQDGAAIGRWITNTTQGIAVFYDLDTPSTISKLENGVIEYLSPELIPQYDLYLSATGGRVLDRLKSVYGSPQVKTLYPSVDSETYHPKEQEKKWDLGFIGTYDEERKQLLQNFLQFPAQQWAEGKFVVAGAHYPESAGWPPNVTRITHVSPSEHCLYYNALRFELSIARASVSQAGYSPSVRLFEAAACATPVISDYWNGLETFFELGKEILVASSQEHVLHYLKKMPEEERLAVGYRARARVGAHHTPARRAAQLEQYLMELLNNKGRAYVAV